MEDSMRKLAVLTVFAAMAFASSANAAEGSILSLGVFQGVGDYAGPEFNSGYITAFDHSEIGVGGEYWHMFSSDYALAIQGSVGFFSETDKPGDNATAGSPDGKFSTTSFKVRVGGDRVGQIGDRFTWFMGPGLEYWNGKAKFEDIFTAGTVETESTTRFGVNGRVGGIMKLNDSVGIQGQVGHTLGYASTEEAGAKATWFPSSFNASWGLAFAFGAN
jgi:Outer membrane protein beta-barrel domain